MEDKCPSLFAFELDSQDEYGCVIVAATTSKQAFDFLSSFIRYKKFNISFDKQLINCISDNEDTIPKIVYKKFIEL